MGRAVTLSDSLTLGLKRTGGQVAAPEKRPAVK